MVFISASVGYGSRNKPTDVALIRQLLNQVDSTRRLIVDGLIWQSTIDAIVQFQQSVVKFKTPDSVIDVDGKTFKALYRGSRSSAIAGTVDHARSDSTR